MNEIEAIEACLLGRGEEFRLIVEAYKGPLTALAVNVLGNRQDAEDVCQETFIQAYRNLGRFDRSLSLKTWLFTILFRRCLDLLKKRRRFRAFFARAAAVESAPACPAGSADRTGSPDRREISRALLKRLSPKERLALVLWANEGLNASEIAGILGCSASTARVHLFTGRKKIKTLLEKGYGTLGNR
jgi:RNA polymerase sigma-70 factor (ECF subfamily)